MVLFYVNDVFRSHFSSNLGDERYRIRKGSVTAEHSVEESNMKMKYDPPKDVSASYAKAIRALHFRDVNKKKEGVEPPPRPEEKPEKK